MSQRFSQYVARNNAEPSQHRSVFNKFTSIHILVVFMLFEHAVGTVDLNLSTRKWPTPFAGVPASICKSIRSIKSLHGFRILTPAHEIIQPKTFQSQFRSAFLFYGLQHILAGLNGVFRVERRVIDLLQWFSKLPKDGRIIYFRRRDKCPMAYFIQIL